MDSREGIKALAREAALLPKEELLQVKQDLDLLIGIPRDKLPKSALLLLQKLLRY